MDDDYQHDVVYSVKTKQKGTDGVTVSRKAKKQKEIKCEKGNYILGIDSFLREFFCSLIESFIIFLKLMILPLIRSFGLFKKITKTK